MSNPEMITLPRSILVKIIITANRFRDIAEEREAAFDRLAVQMSELLAMDEEAAEAFFNEVFSESYKDLDEMAHRSLFIEAVNRLYGVKKKAVR